MTTTPVAPYNAEQCNTETFYFIEYLVLQFVTPQTTHTHESCFSAPQ